QGPGRLHPTATAQCARVLRSKPLADAAVLRDLPGRAETLSTAERIDLDPQPVHPRQVQARGGARVLPPDDGDPEMDKPRPRTADRRGLIRADPPVADEALSTAERIASRRGDDLQGQLSRGVPGTSAGAHRGRLAAGPGGEAEAVPDRARPGFLFHRQLLHDPGRRPGL